MTQIKQKQYHHFWRDLNSLDNKINHIENTFLTNKEKKKFYILNYKTINKKREQIFLINWLFKKN